MPNLDGRTNKNVAVGHCRDQKGCYEPMRMPWCGGTCCSSSSSERKRRGDEFTLVWYAGFDCLLRIAMLLINAHDTIMDMGRRDRRG